MSSVTTVVIESPNLTVRLDCPGGDERLTGEAWDLWRKAHDDLERARSEIRGGSVAGFQIEQGGEELHDQLHGGWVR